MNKSKGKKDILLIEDNPGDIELILEAFNKEDENM